MTSFSSFPPIAPSMAGGDPLCCALLAIVIVEGNIREKIVAASFVDGDDDDMCLAQSSGSQIRDPIGIENDKEPKFANPQTESRNMKYEMRKSNVIEEKPILASKKKRR